MEDEPDGSDAHGGDEDDEGAVVAISNAVVHPFAVMVEDVDASVAVSAVLGAITNI